MARIRSIKPEFFTSLTVASLLVETRLTFIGLWTHVDDEGRCVDDARLIKAAVWPLDDRLSTDVELDLKRLSESSLILRYKVGERSYLAVRGWGEHQRINRPTKSKIPPPPEAPEPPPTSETTPLPPVEIPGRSTPEPSHSEPSPQPHTQLTEDSLAERNREQGTGNREVPPSAERSTALAIVPAEPDTAQALIGEWIDHCRRRPPGQVIGQIGKQLKQMLAENIAPADIRRGLAAWHSKGLHPSALPSVVNELMNAAPAQARPSTTDQRVNAALELAARYAAEEAS
ncbi:hypothetical protein [Salinispora sp. H7-4]|uniref:hypothetical protein n=1 Tax=Salinispora sp. H7-4 TaxID=2748321 RepID=UPI0015D3F6B3|nr:hypothetical protein [Salinispora sp. H7-4]NYT96308.1 hypothetical protein [Salinispora sp. H7-4]